jgi:G3E family GTPase
MNVGIQKTPITILTGYLGSGKTSVLNGALRSPALADSAVVVNELGEIAVDHWLVSEGQENIVLTETGCLCCAALESLPQTLADLFGARAREETPDFKRVFIETTGLADPGPVIRTILQDPIVSHFASLQAVVCTLDAVFGAEQLRLESECQVQAAMADRIILTKTDLIDGPISPELSEILNQINPNAQVLSKEPDRDYEALLGSLSPFAADRPRCLDSSSVGASHHDHGHSTTTRHDPAVTTRSFWLDTPVTWPGLAAWTDWARSRYGAALLRCKGLLAVVNASGPVVLQGVQTLFNTSQMPAWPDGDHRSRLVLIGRGLDHEDIQRSLGLLADPWR